MFLPRSGRGRTVRDFAEVWIVDIHCQQLGIVRLFRVQSAIGREMFTIWVLGGVSHVDSIIVAM